MYKKKIGTLKDLRNSNQFSRWLDGHDILMHRFRLVDYKINTGN